MRLPHPSKDRPPTERVGTVVIHYLPGWRGPNNIPGVEERVFESLAGLIKADQEFAAQFDDLEPDELALMTARRQETHSPIPIISYLVIPGRKGRPGTLRFRRTYMVSHWLMQSAEFQDPETVIALSLSDLPSSPPAWHTWAGGEGPLSRRLKNQQLYP
jgi:hypothetical protein